jgi:membrane protein
VLAVYRPALVFGLYLGTSGVTSAYGAAGSFVLILLWVYY